MSRFTLRWTNVKKWTRFGQATQSRPIFNDGDRAMSYQDVIATLNEFDSLLRDRERIQIASDADSVLASD